MEDAFSNSEYDFFIGQNRQIIMDGIFGSNTPIQVGSSMAFAKYLSHVGISPQNYLLFLKITETNNLWIVDELLADRDPRLLFSVIRPNSHLIQRALVLLSVWHPGQIYSKVLLSILGIIEYSYYKPDDGYTIHPLEITDLHNLGKFLDERTDQTDLINSSILDILDRLTRLGEYERSTAKNIIAKHAFNIRDSYFDNTKTLLDTIPRVLLVRLKRDETEVRPSKEFVDFAKKIPHN